MTGDDEQLREKLAKVEALFRQTGSPGERAAAGAAAERLRGRLGSADSDGGPETELQFSLPDLWSVRLFVAVCRKHGLRPFRYARQRRTTVMAQAREGSFDRVVWDEFSRLQTELQFYFEDVTDHLITRAILGRRRQYYRPPVAAVTPAPLRPSVGLDLPPQLTGICRTVSPRGPRRSRAGGPVERYSRPAGSKAGLPGPGSIARRR